MKEVGEKGVHLTDFKALAKSESKYLEEYFMKEIVPLLSVMIVGRKQPFPFLKGQEIYALAVTWHKEMVRKKLRDHSMQQFCIPEG